MRAIGLYVLVCFICLATGDAQRSHANTVLSSTLYPSAINFTGTCRISFGLASLFDVTSLGTMAPSKGYAGRASDGKYTYLLNVCESVNCSHEASAICQFKNGVAEASLANYAAKPVPYWQLINQNDPHDGVRLVFNNGDPCYDLVPPRPRTVNLNFVCDQNEGIGGNYTVTEDGVCQYSVFLPTSLGCPTIVPPPLPPINPPKNSLSGGSIFLIVFFVLAVAYVFAGCVYNRAVIGKVGMEACPQFAFWRTVPTLVGDGCRYTWSVITCARSRAQGDSSYETIQH